MSKTSKNKRSISDKEKIKILRKQEFKCANTPESKLYNLDGYECLLWKYNGGVFDKSGFEADHVIEYCLSQDSSLSNMQLLCHSCHAQKTRNFAESKNAKDKNPKNKNPIYPNTITKDTETISKIYVNGIVIYKCLKCEKEFNNKRDSKNHLARKTPCKPLTAKKLLIQSQRIIRCEICDIVFGRKDYLTSHYKCASHLEKEKIFLEQNNNSKNDNSKNDNFKNDNSKKISKSHNIGNKNNINKTTNSNNTTNNINIINPTIYLCPFRADDISILSSDEKIQILDGKEHPLSNIISKTSLNPGYPQFHNIGYTDIKNSYGFIYNGEEWERIGIKVALHELMESKYQQLLLINKQMRDFVSVLKHNNFVCKLEDIVDLISPKNTLHTKHSTNFIGQLKRKFYDNRELYCTMFELTGKKIKKTKSTLDIDTKTNPDPDSGIIPLSQLSPYVLWPLYEEQQKLLNPCESSALEILDMKYSKHNKDQNYNTIQAMIKDLGNYRRINIVIRIILRSMITNTALTVDFIKRKMDEEIEMQNSINCNCINTYPASKIKKYYSNNKSDNESDGESDDESDDESNDESDESGNESNDESEDGTDD